MGAELVLAGICRGLRPVELGRSRGSVSKGLATVFGGSAPDRMCQLAQRIVYGLVFLSADLFLWIGVLLGLLGRTRSQGNCGFDALDSESFAAIRPDGLWPAALRETSTFWKRRSTFPTCRAIWPLEESFEVLGAAALLIAVVARWRALAR